MGISTDTTGTHINEARPEATEIRWHLNPSARQDSRADQGRSCARLRPLTSNTEPKTMIEPTERASARLSGKEGAKTAQQTPAFHIDGGRLS